MSMLQTWSAAIAETKRTHPGLDIKVVIDNLGVWIEARKYERGRCAQLRRAVSFEEVDQANYDVVCFEIANAIAIVTRYSATQKPRLVGGKDAVQS